MNDLLLDKTGIPENPTTISLADYVQRIAETVYPDYPLSRAKTKVWQAIRDGEKAKKNPLRLMPAPPPFPKGHVFSDRFFLWALKRWPNKIPWMHPPVIECRMYCHLPVPKLPTPRAPPTYAELQQEVRRLLTENKELSEQLRKEKQRAEKAEKELKKIRDRGKAATAKKVASGHLGGRGKKL